MFAKLNPRKELSISNLKTTLIFKINLNLLAQVKSILNSFKLNLNLRQELSVLSSEI